MKTIFNISSMILLTAILFFGCQSNPADSAEHKQMLAEHKTMDEEHEKMKREHEQMLIDHENGKC